VLNELFGKLEIFIGLDFVSNCERNWQCSGSLSSHVVQFVYSGDLHSKLMSCMDEFVSKIHGGFRGVELRLPFFSLHNFVWLHLSRVRSWGSMPYFLFSAVKWMSTT